MSSRSRVSPMRAVFFAQLHLLYQPHEFDNWLVWAGNHRIRIDDIDYPATLARAYIGADHPRCIARVRVELFVSAVTAADVRPGDVDVRLWTDANLRGFVDTDGVFLDDPGTYMDMHLVCDADGAPCLEGNNLVFESAPFPLDTTGVFSYSVDFSADSQTDPELRHWVNLSDLADNRNGVIVVSPTWVRDCPTVVEICPRKVGARIIDGRFRSGRLQDVTAVLEEIPGDVIYLLPFYKPGHTDLHTGADVRKGDLGSPYAVQDFFQIDPQLITPPDECDLEALVQQDLLTEADAVQLGLPGADAFARLSARALEQRVGREPLLQAIGRADLRALTRRAHQLGKRVIFDLVLMQTSRDCPLISQHPEWYVLDENGIPRIHQIAWLVYSDVALFDLIFNWPLQDYLSGVAPYWMEQCDLDGVRIDASQTVDRPFLKRIKNRIDLVKPQALVLGETLCPLEEAVDTPVDMIYALLVDFHRDVEQATPLIDFLEQMHAQFAPRTVAMAYFENHDSPRATHVWHGKYSALLAADSRAADWWRERADALRLALLKNLQASLIDLSAGYSGGTNLTCGLEWGSWWGELQSTDFQNATVLDVALRTRAPHSELRAAYTRLCAVQQDWREVRSGRIYYHRNGTDGGDPDDRVCAYMRYDDTGALLFLHNLDATVPRGIELDLSYLPWPVTDAEVLFDTHAALKISGTGAVSPVPVLARTTRWRAQVQPLQSVVVRLHH